MCAAVRSLLVDNGCHFRSLAKRNVLELGRLKSAATLRTRSRVAPLQNSRCAASAATGTVINVRTRNTPTRSSKLNGSPERRITTPTSER